jgi:hypothetical protein
MHRHRVRRGRGGWVDGVWPLPGTKGESALAISPGSPSLIGPVAKGTSHTPLPGTNRQKGRVCMAHYRHAHSSLPFVRRGPSAGSRQPAPPRLPQEGPGTSTPSLLMSTPPFFPQGQRALLFLFSLRPGVQLKLKAPTFRR